MDNSSDYIGTLVGINGAGVTGIIRDLDLSVESVEHIDPSPGIRYGMPERPTMYFNSSYYDR